MALHRKVSYICLSYTAGSHFFNPTINLVQTVDFPFQYVQSLTYWNASFKDIDQMRCSWSVGALSLQSAFDTWRSITFGETPSPFYYIFLCPIAGFLIFMNFSILIPLTFFFTSSSIVVCLEHVKWVSASKAQIYKVQMLRLMSLTLRYGKSNIFKPHHLSASRQINRQKRSHLDTFPSFYAHFTFPQ